MVPDDDLKRAQVAQATMAVGVSREKTLSEVMGIQDPVGEMERARLEQLQERPEAQDELLLSAMWEEVALLEAEADRETERGKQVRLQKAATRARLRAQSLESRLSGQPQGSPPGPKPAGIAPEQQPPEARGAENPDAQAAIAGAAQSYMGGNPGGGEV